MPVIKLPYEDNKFDSNDLKAYLRTVGCDYIIQGQQNCRRSKHTKPGSLDCWLRDNYAKRPDTKQAVNEVMTALVRTGDFEEGEFICPESKRRCKGIKALL